MVCSEINSEELSRNSFIILLIHFLIFVLIEFPAILLAHMAPGRLPITELLRLVSAYKGEIHGQDREDQSLFFVFSELCFMMLYNVTRCSNDVLFYLQLA